MGSGIRILNNDVIDTFAVGVNGPDGIDVSQTAGAVVEGNRISHLTNAGTGILLNLGTTNALVVGNRITNTRSGVFYNGSSNTGKYRDNLTSGCTTPYNAGGATDAGNNY